MCLPKDLKGATIQRIVTVVGNILCLNFGLMFGITPSHMLLYQTENTPLNRPACKEAVSWVMGTFFLSAALGSLLFGFISQKIGPKSVLLLSGLLQISSWSCIHFAYDMMHIYFSRFFGGMAAGVTFTVLPIYISEISQDFNTGGLIATIEQWRTLGLLIGFILGQYLQYKYVPIVALCISCTFTMMFPFSQESPYYFMRQGNEPSLEKSLRWFRGVRRVSDRNRPEYLAELAVFKRNMVKCTFVECDVPMTYIMKTMLYTFVLIVGAQLSGCYVLLAWPNTINEITQITELKTEVNTLILSAVQFVGATITVWLWPEFRRKLLLSIAAVFCGASCALLSSYVIYSHVALTYFKYAPWVAFGILILHVFLANLGLHSLATLFPVEALPTKLRITLTSFMWSLSWILLFVLIQYYNPLSNRFGLESYFGLYAVSCFIVACAAIFLLPETHGRSCQEVQRDMGYINVMSEGVKNSAPSVIQIDQEQH